MNNNNIAIEHDILLPGGPHVILFWLDRITVYVYTSNYMSYHKG